jgi:hypothetical protein
VFEWMLWDAFELGYTVGVMCNSDGHKGRPGAEGPGAGEFGIGGGLTCVLAEELTRAAVFTALRERRCYGTTGPRIALEFSAGDAAMGEVVTAREGTVFAARAAGVEPLESLTLFRGREAVRTVRPPAFGRCGGSNRIRVSWRGSRMRGRGRRVTWDGRIKVEGARMVRAEPHAFDSPAHGICLHDPHEVEVTSQTTGDTDGVDLWLDDPSRAVITADLQPGMHRVAVGELDEQGGAVEFAMGGLDMVLRIERYPVDLESPTLSLEYELSEMPAARTPWFVKAVQADGHTAWSSPVYLDPDASATKHGPGPR